jgi:hypothetical protein
MAAIKKISPIRVRKSSRILDLRKSHYNHIVCADTGEIVRSYKAYLNSKHWRLFRKNFKKSSCFTGRCCICGKIRGLHLHHITYIRIGMERFSDVRELCKGCHRNVHRAMRKNSLITWEDIEKQLS